MKTEFVATVVIPARNRDWQVDRAIQSICSQADSDRVEIIVVDDASDIPLAPSSLRHFDRLIRMPRNVGAAVCRNVGIKSAQGRLVYLLDSDDYFVTRNFVRDSSEAAEKVLYYSDIHSQGYKSSFPEKLGVESFFDCIFRKHRFIAQTSSLFFVRDGTFYFDESLPKHQDWDFVYCSALLSGFKVERREGVIYFDRSDQNSISRVSSAERSKVWFQKLSNLDVLSGEMKAYVYFNLFARTKDFSTYSVLREGLRYVSEDKLSWRDYLRISYRRISA